MSTQPRSLFQKIRDKVRLRTRLHDGLIYVGNRIGRVREICQYRSVKPTQKHLFFIVSCQRNVEKDAIKCLESVYRQKYDPDRICHLFIDDASNDRTDSIISKWLNDHPNHRVDYIHNPERKGGTHNTVEGFRKAPPGSIIIELNGDDWLPDPEVLNFLNKVYSDPDVWMTYNSCKFSDGRFRNLNIPIPEKIAVENRYRDCPWYSGHLHTFRTELFSHIQESTLIDPQTGEYWQSADDQAIYLAMLEMCGPHARHLYRITYIYNYHDQADDKIDFSGSRDRMR